MEEPLPLSMEFFSNFHCIVMLRIIWPLTQNLDKGFCACGKLFATACTIMHLPHHQNFGGFSLTSLRWGPENSGWISRPQLQSCLTNWCSEFISYFQLGHWMSKSPLIVDVVIHEICRVICDCAENILGGKFDMLWNGIRPYILTARKEAHV